MKDDSFLGLLVAIGFVFMCIVVISANGCEPDVTQANRVLEDEGFTDISLTGWQPFSCGEGDTTNTGFTATRIMPDGSHRQVSGVVCCGVFKDCTVRH